VLPELDDEFAKDVGDFDSLAALRDRVRTDMQADAEEHARQHLRNDLLKQLGQRITFELPPSLVDREIDRRLEEFARRLMDQNVDPRKAGIDWAQFREAQREGARDSVASVLVLDEIARRESLTVAPEDVDKEVERFAERSGRTPAAVRAQLEKDGGIARLTAGLRREKAVDLAMSRAKMTSE
jgi:trigger factor